jgi:hypothetical protein
MDIKKFRWILAVYFVFTFLLTPRPGYAAASYEWTKTFGSTNNDYGYGIVTDTNGNIYITGSFYGQNVDFDPSDGEDIQSAIGESHAIFVSKYNSGGTYQWTRVIGGAGESPPPDYGKSITVDSSGNVYIVGSFKQTVDFNFDPVAEDNHTSTDEYTDSVFVTRINSDGTYGWTVDYGELSGKGEGIATDNDGNVYITGAFPSINPEIFIAKISPLGVKVWQKELASDTWNNYTRGFSIINRESDLFVAGQFVGTVDFDPGESAVEKTASSNLGSSFVLKLDTAGNFIWVNTFGGNCTEAEDSARGITLDSTNGVYAVGSFCGSVDFDPGTGEAIKSSAGMSDDIYLVKFLTDGTFSWVKTIGNDSNDSGYSVNINLHDEIYFAGNFTGSNVNFNTDGGTDLKSSNGGPSVFLTKLNSNGTYNWTKTFGGTDEDFFAYSIAFGPEDEVYLTGSFSETGVDFNPDGIEDLHDSLGMLDVYLYRLLDPYASTGNSNSSGNVHHNPSPSSNNWSYPVSAGPHYSGIADFICNGACVLIANTAHHDDIYIQIIPRGPDYLSSFKPQVNLPTKQGYRPASEIIEIKALSSFNGYPIQVLDNPITVLLKYFDKFQNKNPYLKIAFYKNGVWKLLNKNTVVNPVTNTVANTTKNLNTYFVLVYPQTTTFPPKR